MGRKRTTAPLAVAVMGLGPVVLSADWRSRAINKAVGKAAREGLEDAARRLEHADLGHGIGGGAAEGFESAMKAARMAEDLDDVADTAKTMKKINRVRKLVN